MISVKQNVRLLSGHDMPLVGIGTYKVRSSDIFRVLDESLNSGFRSIDTAAVYRNEEAIGTALKTLLPKYNLKRENLFITTKLSPSDNGNPKGIREAVETSLKALDTTYVDLYLIHWPGASRIPERSSDNSELRSVTWKTLVDLHKQGLLNSIGVSNYNINHLEQLLADCDGVKPSVNQVECHPHYRQDDLLKYCTQEGIHLQAYSSLGSSDNGALLNDTVVRQVSSTLNVSPSRLLLKWALQRGIGIIPKATKTAHIRDNIKLDFTIDKDSMELLLNLPTKKYAWDPNFADKVSKLCLDKYNYLKKSGKPTNNEWTVLSGIVLKSNLDQLSVVALCTGTKCLSGKELTSTTFEERGSRLSDSHAEILARRAVLRYLYNQIASVLKCQHSDIFILNDKGNITIKNGISFHFFSSQTPCGDCSIVPKMSTYLSNGHFLNQPLKKIKLDNEQSPGVEIGNEVDDIHRTGAKCVSTDVRQDLHQPGKNYHVLGPLRTKPGRGDRTLSLSCSDKIAKWIAVGIQGSLLSLFIPEIKLETIIIGGDCPFSLESMERGLFKRFNPDFVGPKIIQSSISFQQKRGCSRQNPCPSSIIWSSVAERDLEVAADGRKQGSTKKKPGTCLLVSRRAIFKTFLEIYDRYSNSLLPQHPKKITYFHCKQWSQSYQKLWHEAKVTAFHSWPSKPIELQNFTL